MDEQLNITDHASGVKNTNVARHTNLLDVFEGDFLALSSRHREDVHLQRSQS